MITILSFSKKELLPTPQTSRMKIQSRESTTPMAFLSKNGFMRDMGYISTLHYGARESCESSTENKRIVNEHPASPRNCILLYNDDS